MFLTSTYRPTSAQNYLKNKKLPTLLKTSNWLLLGVSINHRISTLILTILLVLFVRFKAILKLRRGKLVSHFFLV